MKPNISSINSEVIIEQVDDNFVILKPSNGAYIVLSQTGSLIWKLLADGIDASNIPSHLATTHQVSEEEAQLDLDAFLAELTQRGFLLHS